MAATWAPMRVKFISHEEFLATPEVNAIVQNLKSKQVVGKPQFFDEQGLSRKSAETGVRTLVEILLLLYIYM